MAFIGNSVQTQGFTPAIDYFSGNGSTVTFTLSRPVASVAQMIVAIDNVIQNPSSSFTVSGNSITFSSAPLAGTNNIWVEYTSLITTYNAISQSPSVIGDITASGGYLASGSFNNTFLDGTIVDYVTGNGRVTVGTADGFTIYNGGTSARSALASWDTSGNLLLGGITSWSYGGNNGIQNRASAGNNSSIFLETASAAIKTVIASDTNASLATLGTLTNHPLRFNTNDTERMRINTNGNIALQGGTTTATGVGITFPASQSASTDPNCLDDYEEGTWTPVITNGTTNVTSYYWQLGYYMKVGKYVFLSMQISVQTVGIASGNIKITGMPFASANPTGYNNYAFYGSKYSPTTGAVFYQNNGGETQIFPYFTASYPTQLTYTDLGAGGQWFMQGWYQTSA